MLSFCFRVFTLLIFGFGFNLFSQVSSYTVNIVYPWEGKNISNVSKSFIFGNVNPFISTISVNGQSVKVNPNGSFIAYVPISSSNPFFVVEVAGNLYKRGVILSEKRKEITKDNPFEILTSTNLSVMKGENICISFRGKEKSKVRILIDGIVKKEIDDDGNGLYEYCFDLPNSYKSDFYDLELKYIDGELKGEKIVLEKFLNIIDNYFYVETATDNVVLKNEANGYITFIPNEVGLYCDMFDLSKYRVVLDNIKLWVDKDKVIFRKNVSRLSKARVSTIRFFKGSSNRVLSKIFISNKVPFSVWQDNKKFFIQLYNAISNINWIVYDSSDSYTDNVVFRQISDRAVLVNFNFNDELWGYDINYSTDGSLDVEFKFKPYLAFDSTQPLKGLNVIIDPGHSPKNEPPYDGAVGPSGSYEYAVNLYIAKRLYDLFINSGANVFMTRYTNDKIEQVPLADRPRIAKKLNGDIYLSIHNNAIPDGEDPYFKPRGFQIYYYHLHSKKLAYHIHRSFIKNIPLPDEGLRFGDYMVARITQMPSVLVENAYLILPEHEEMLLNPFWQQKFAQSIFDGVLEFLKEK